MGIEANATASGVGTNFFRALIRKGQLEIRMLGVVLFLVFCLSIGSPFFMTINNIFNVMDQCVVVSKARASMGRTSGDS